MADFGAFNEDSVFGTPPNSNNLGGQSSDDDSNSGNTTGSSGPGSGGGTEDADTEYRTGEGSTPTTTAGAAGTTDTAVKDKKGTGGSFPKRPFNPLAKFSSYTYNITLYMITPEAYNVFIETGKKTLRESNGKNYDGVYIVAQSGGIDNNVSQRPPGMTMDYYIDNLKIKTYTTGPGTTDASTNTQYTWNIYEPNGFSFVSKLSEAAKILLQNSTLEGINDSNKNALRQHFVLSIGFAGYLGDGSVASAKDIFSSDTFTTQDGTVYERFFDITVTEMKFALDGQMVNYAFKASTTGTIEGQGTKRGALYERGLARGATVEEALLGPGGIIPFVNEQQVKLYNDKKIKIPYVYDVKFVDHPDSAKIKNAKLVTKEELITLYRDKLGQVPMSGALKVNEVNDATAVKTGTASNSVKELKFEPNTAMGAVIKKLIQSSTYLADGLLAFNQSQLEPETENNTEDDDTIEKPASVIQWYSLASEVKVIGWDKQRNDWAYKITYIIAPFRTPLTSSIYAGKTTKYYGPHKRYKYWFTGENTEVIKYSQALNVAWYEAVAGFSDSLAAPQGPPKNQGQRVPGDKQGSLGQGLDPQNNYINSLYSPADWTVAKIEIHGDPDFLMYDSPGNLNEIYSVFYAGQNDFTINANGGQVFVEIQFFEGMDYNHDTSGTVVNDGNFYDDGLMTINRSIMFWEYPEFIKKTVQGISYMVRIVDSTFSKGKFTQVLDMNINTFDDIKEVVGNQGQQPSQREASRQNPLRVQEANARIPQQTSTSASTSAAANNAGSSGSSPAGGTSPKKNIATTPTTPSGKANDDGANNRDQLLASQTVPVPSVNERLREGFGTGVNSLVNRARQRLGLPVGGTNPGGG